MYLFLLGWQFQSPGARVQLGPSGSVVPKESALLERLGFSRNGQPASKAA